VDLGHFGDEFFNSIDCTGLTIDHTERKCDKTIEKMFLVYIARHLTVHCTNYTVFYKQLDITWPVITLSNVNQFSQFLHYYR